MQRLDSQEMLNFRKRGSPATIWYSKSTFDGTTGTSEAYKDINRFGLFQEDEAIQIAGLVLEWRFFVPWLCTSLCTLRQWVEKEVRLFGMMVMSEMVLDFYYVRVSSYNKMKSSWMHSSRVVPSANCVAELLRTSNGDVYWKRALL